MAIQKINLGSEPLGEGGDTYRSANTKINENFSNTDHAASKLVGAVKGRVPLFEDAGQSYLQFLGDELPSSTDLDSLFTPQRNPISKEIEKTPVKNATGLFTSKRWDGSGKRFTQHVVDAGTGEQFLRVKGWVNLPWTEWRKIYDTGNTKKDSKSNLLLDSGDSIPSNSAASRLVGTAAGNIPEMQGITGVAGTGIGGRAGTALRGSELNAVEQPLRDNILFNSLWAEGGTRTFIVEGTTTDFAASHNPCLFIRAPSSFMAMSVAHTANRVNVYAGYAVAGSDTLSIRKHQLWTSLNATKDANGFLKASSPIVKVFADKAELNGEAEDQDVTYKKNGIGDYTITTVSGLSTEGWYIELPKDINGNPKVAVTLSEVDGVISLKTYKRIFSMETFTFEPDLDNPLDIPDTRWIDLRLNEIPVEVPEEELYEPELEEEPEVVEDTEEPVEESK